MAKVIIVMRNGFVADVFSAQSQTANIDRAITDSLVGELSIKVANTLHSLKHDEPHSGNTKSVAISVKIALFDVREV